MTAVRTSRSSGRSVASVELGARGTATEATPAGLDAASARHPEVARAAWLVLTTHRQDSRANCYGWRWEGSALTEVRHDHLDGKHPEVPEATLGLAHVQGRSHCLRSGPTWVGLAPGVPGGASSESLRPIVGAGNPLPSAWVGEAFHDLSHHENGRLSENSRS